MLNTEQDFEDQLTCVLPLLLRAVGLSLLLHFGLPLLLEVPILPHKLAALHILALGFLLRCRGGVFLRSWGGFLLGGWGRVLHTLLADRWVPGGLHALCLPLLASARPTAVQLKSGTTEMEASRNSPPIM